MKKTISLAHALVATTIIASAFLLSAGMAQAAGPAPVNLLSAGTFVILAETTITTTGVTSITGNVGISPNGASSLTGFGQVLDGSGTFSTSALVTGKIYASDYTPPTPINMGIAIGDMTTAYTTAAGMSGPDATELGAGNIGGMTLAPGLYKWSTGVTIPTNVTLSGGPDDVWVFQIAGDLSIASGGDLASGIKVVLTGGAQASNVFWQVGGPTGATLGTFSTFNGSILSAKQVIMQNGAVLNGRALAQTQVTLIGNSVSIPVAILPSCTATSTQAILSDTANNTVALGGAPAVTVIPHVAWTAVIPGSTTWIWETGPTAVDEVVAFEQSFTVSGTVLSATLDIAADNSYKVFIDGVQVAADPAENNFQLATQDTHNLTVNVTPGTHTLRIEVKNSGTFNASANPAGLLYKFVVETCPPPLPPTGDVTVTIVKNIGGVHATAGNASSASFPMASSWDAVNLGGPGSGTYPLSTVGFNTPNPYEAVTSNMTNGSDYTTNEDTSTSVVGPNCASGQQFRLVGYTTGSSLALAQASTPTTTVPSFTNFTTNRWVIVWNEPCVATPPPLCNGAVPLTQTILSDTSNMIGGGNAIAVIPHAAWTAAIAGSTTWIWQASSTAPNATVAFEKTFTVSGTVLSAQLDIASDNNYQVFIDNVLVAADASATNFTLATQDTYNLTANVTPGTHTLRIEVTNQGTYNTSSNPAGLLYKFVIVTCPTTTPPPPPALACNTPLVAPAGYTLQNGTTGNDNVTLVPLTMFVGKGGNDSVTGPDGNYIICTLNGNDRITIGHGDYTISAGGGNNTITTGDGDGVITTTNGTDLITTGTGNHTINAGGGNNAILTGDGTQTITTLNGNDTITTGSGGDTIAAGGGNNNVISGGGIDTITAGSGNDIVDGGTGIDSCSVGGGLNTVTNCP